MTACLVKKGETNLRVLLKTVERTANVKAKHGLEKRLKRNVAFQRLKEAVTNKKDSLNHSQKHGEPGLSV